MFILFLAFLIGPIFAGKIILKAASSLVEQNALLYDYFQPTGLNNNDTRGTLATGISAESNLATASPTDTVNRMIRLF